MAILKDLIVHGSSRFLNKIYASEIQTPLIEAEAGIFKKLKADDATVVGLLDVRGQLHTNSWSNSNIATIDGSFYITPTIGSDSGTVTITANSLNFSGTNFAVVSSLQLGDGSSISWPQYSKVLITGQILSGEEWIPLGTLLGQLTATATAASIKIGSITDNKNQSSNILASLVNNGITSSDYRNLKISLYQRASNSTTFYPLGIFMTSMGTNGKTFLDIYGGVQLLTTQYGGYANPNVRIGNLNGLPNVGGQTPNGWGIYTDNGYFKGIIAADQGYIGSGSRYWVIASEEDGSNPNNSRSYIYSYNGTDNGTDSVTSTVEGIYLGTDGIRNYKDSTHHVTIKNGVITALGVDLTGTINATAGNIGGATIEGGVLTVPAANISGQLTAATIDASKINSGNISSDRITTNVLTALQAKLTSLNTNNLSAITANLGTITAGVIKHDTVGGTNGIWFSADTDTSSNVTVGNSTARKDWRLLVNNKFGVTKEGDLYASSVDLTGKITATSGTIGGIGIENGALKVSSINIGDLGGASSYAQKTDVTQAIDNIEIGGRNLLKESDILDLSKTNKGVTRTYLGDGWFEVDGTVTGTNSGILPFYGTGYHTSNIVGSGTYTLSIETTGTVLVSNLIYVQTAFHSDTATDDTVAGGFNIFSDNSKVIFTVPENNHISRVCLLFKSNATNQQLNGTIRFKLEKGNKATYWTPAPEDVDADIKDARKVATNYLAVDSTGIMVADMEHGEQTPSTATGRNVFIDSDSVDIRDGQKTLASFRGEDTKFYDVNSDNKEVASFGSNGVRVGSEEEQHFIVDSESIQAINENGSSIFSVQSTGGTITTEIIVAKGGNSQPRTDWKVYLNGGSSVPQNTFYAKEYSLSIDIDNSINTFNSMMVSVNDGDYQNVPVVRKFYQNTSGMTVYSRHLVTLPPFSFQYGTEKTFQYEVEGVYISDKGNTYRYSSYIRILYDGQRTITMAKVGGTLTKTSGNVSGDDTSISPGWGNTTFWGDIYSGLGYAKAPAMTFGTRGRAGTVAPLSVTIGEELYANNDNQLSIGRYNLNNDDPLAFAIGNGANDTDRSNAFTVDWDGNTEIAGNLNVEALTVNARKPFSLVRQTYTRTITANSRCYINQEYTPPTGYIPVGIIGWGTFNGTHADHCIIGHAYVWGGNPNTIDIYVWNQHPSESATNVVIYVDILYIADTFL